MLHSTPRFSAGACAALLGASAAALLLTACGGGSDAGAPGANVATGTTVVQMNAVALPSAVSTQVLQPAFFTSPVVPAMPQDVVNGASFAAAGAPATSVVPAALDGVASRRLTPAALQAAVAGTSSPGAVPVGTVGAKPFTAGSVVSTYTPAQIRAAYGLPALPSSFTGLSTVQAAQMGAGQTIYVVDAQHDPNAAAELAAFNAKFGLPVCTTRTIATTASLPLASPSANGCDFSVVYATASGTMTTAAPAYDSGWATEITLDVQWAHATAPLARIVLVEAPDASMNSLLGAIQVANTLGQGVVSMSFGGAEGSWTSSVDSYFTAPGMTYLAATGDNGAGVSWPSVSPHVVAVGGTTLSYSGSGSRTEVSWTGTGGGTSAYTATPSYQTSTVPGMGTLAHRTVADVAFNADPSSGQYIVTIAPGSTAQNWFSVGGTSLSTPQWAGLIAVANAVRATTGKTALGAPHAVLYGQIASTPATYASVFADITKGSDGTCSTCVAKLGYDPLSGLGTPNTASLLTALSGAALPVAAPVVTAASISGQVGTPLSFTVSATSVNPLSYTLSGAPSGMAISTAGVVSWATPVAGTYAVTVVAKDSKANLSGQAVYTVTIAAPQAPAIAATTLNGTVGKALSYVVTATAANPVSYSMTGAPAGLTLSSSGTLAWTNPVLGTFTVTVTAKDSKTNLSGSGVVTIKIAAATVSGPVITAPAITGTAGKALSGNIVISDPGVAGLSVSITGVPFGMTFSANGLTLTANWAKPVTGKYSLLIQVTDTAGHSAQATLPITIQ